MLWGGVIVAGIVLRWPGTLGYAYASAIVGRERVDRNRLPHDSESNKPEGVRNFSLVYGRMADL